MNLFENEQARIDEVGKTAWSLICSGEHDAARSKLKSIANSFCILESTQVSILLEAEMLSREGKQEAAEKLIRGNLGYLWGLADAMAIFNRGNALIDSNTSLFHIEIRGGQATLGGFTTFDDEHIARFDVLANSEREAMEYIERICTFLKPEGKEVLQCELEAIELDPAEHRGVVVCYPFRT